MKTSPDQLKTVLATDCGSTTTKALLFEKTDAGWRQTCRGEAPTTVEKPVADVTVGASNAFLEIQELSGRKILKEQPTGDSPFIESSEEHPEEGIDLYLSTSSAGGGLQMLVSGVVRQMTTESAERAALGAGAIVLDAISVDDGREDYEKIERIRHLRPDIVLITGGVDGGSENHVIEMAEILLAAAPRPRFGDTLQLPVIYAGNKDAASEVYDILAPIAQVSLVENVRPTLDVENLGPARESIHEFFLTHVMSHSPGYDRLLSWTPVPVMPTPAAVGNMISSYAKKHTLQILCADIGGATTDVFSVFFNQEGEPIFNRTVSANLGMSYSVANVLVEAGVDNISRWLNYTIDDSEIRDRLRNKMIRPTSIPQALEDLVLEQAVCREALRLSLAHHRSLAVGLSGVTRQRGISDIFAQTGGRYQLVNLRELDIVVGSGGVLSHAPHRLQAALMMMEGFGLEGVTEVAVDSIFMMPHLGVLASVHEAAADEIFLNDCIIRIAHAVVPIYPQRVKKGTSLAKIYFDGELVGEVTSHQVTLLEFPGGKKGVLRVEPASRSIAVTHLPGQSFEKEVVTGEFGFLLDGRNRPIQLHESPEERARQHDAIFRQVGLQASMGEG